MPESPAGGIKRPFGAPKGEYGLAFYKNFIGIGNGRVDALHRPGRFFVSSEVIGGENRISVPPVSPGNAYPPANSARSSGTMR